MASSSSQSSPFLTFFFFIFFSATYSQEASTDPSYYYNLCAPSTCGNLTFSYPFSLPTFCRHPKLNSTCSDNHQHLLLNGLQPQSDPHRVVGNMKIDGPNFTIPIASNALFSCGPVSKPNYFVDTSIFCLSDDYTYGTHLNCTRKPANNQALEPVSCLGCEGDAVGNVCYYMPGLVSVPECENFFMFTPKGMNVSAEKDLRGFLKKGFDIIHTMSEECRSCEGSGGRCGAGPDGSFVCFCPSNAHRHNCSGEVIDLKTWKTVAGSWGRSKRLVVA